MRPPGAARRPWRGPKRAATLLECANRLKNTPVSWLISPKPLDGQARSPTVVAAWKRFSSAFLHLSSRNPSGRILAREGDVGLDVVSGAVGGDEVDSQADQ